MGGLNSCAIETSCGNSRESTTLIIPAIRSGKSWARVSPPVTWRPRPPLGAALLGALLLGSGPYLSGTRSSGHVPATVRLRRRCKGPGRGGA